MDTLRRTSGLIEADPLQAEVADLTAKAEAMALNNVRSEWSLVTMAWNIKQMFVLVGTN
jgi:hypothetical protein